MKLFKKKSGKKSKKILVLLIAALIAVSVISGMIVFRRMHTKEPEVISRYELGEESISSILTIVGDREVSEIVEEKGADSEKVKYCYQNISTGSDDAKAYAQFLMDECGFKPMMDFNVDNPAGYISLAKQSAQQGRLFQIDIDYTPEDYTIILSTPEGDLPTPDPQEKNSFTRSDAQAFLNQVLPEDLGLSAPVSSYVTIFDQGRMIIDQNDCYGINVYQKGVGQSNEIVGKYFVALDKSCIYKYSVADNTYTMVYHDDKVADANGQSTKIQKENLEKIHQSLKAAVDFSMDILFQY